MGGFAVNHVLAHGGMSIVYAGHHPDTGERVAIKTVTLSSEIFLTSLRREIHALSRVRHPGVVRIVNHGVTGGVPWYAMELIDGDTLGGYARSMWGAFDLDRDTFDASGPTDSAPSLRSLRAPGARASSPGRPAAGGDLPTALTIARRLCSSLAYLHGEGIVHRDLKPTNIVMRPDRRPVLVNFGLAWRIAGGRGREAPDVLRDLAGTPEYMAPEQAQLEHLDPRTDLYALGCILYYLVGGRPPFLGSSDRVIQQHINDPPPPLSTQVSGVPTELDELISALLAKQPRDRVGYAEDVARVLESLGAQPETEPLPRPRTYVYGPRLSGRSRAFAELRHLLAQTRRKRGGIALVTGESGIGKTYLVIDAARQCGVGAWIFSCECAPLARPLQPLRGLLTSVADRCRTRGAAFTDRVLGARGKILAAIEPHLGDLPGQSAYPTPPRLTGPAARDRLMQALRETLDALQQIAPVIVIIDDLQWADELTLRLLATLPDDWFDGRSVAVLATCRDGAGAGAQSALSARLYVSHLALGRLDGEHVSALVADMLALDVVPSELGHVVAEQSGGNPFVVAEYLRAAVDEGHIRRRSPSLVEHDSLPTLASLATLVEHRLAGLSAGARAMLEAATVLGRELALDLLLEVAGHELDPDPGLDALSELFARHVLEQPGPTHIRFIHDKLHEITYDRLSGARRATLHRRAADAIAARARTREERRDVAMILAHHCAAAGEPARALDHLEAAGETALADAAYRRAVLCFERADALHRAGATAADARRGRWQLGLAQASFGLGELDAVEEQAALALERMGHKVPRSRLRWGARLARELSAQSRHLLGVRRHPRSAVERARLGDAAVTASLLSHRYFYIDEPLGMLAASLMAVNLAERGRAGTRVPRPYAQLAFTSGLLGLHPVARHYFDRARAAARDHTDPTEVAFAYMVEAVYLGSLGQWQRAEEMADDAANRLRLLYDPTLLEMAITTLGHIEYYTGRLEAACQHYREVLSSARARASHQHATWGLFSIGRSLLPMGRPAEALELLREAREALGQRPELQSEIICTGLLSAATLRCGDEIGALELAEETLAIVRRSRPVGFPELEGYRGAAETFVALGERGAAAVRARDGAEKMTQQLARIARVFPIARPALRLHRSELARMDGNQRVARREADRSLALARQLELPGDEALALIALSRCQRDPTARAAAIDAAASIGARIGARHLVNRALSIR